MSIGERIRKRRKELGFSAMYVAEKLGKDRATVYRYESNEIEDVPITVIRQLAEILKVDPGYLMGWKKTAENLDSTSNYAYYPTSISAGLPIVAESVTEYDVEKINIPDYLMGKWAGNNDIFFTKINGDSMNKIIPDQSLIAVKPIEQHELKDGDIVVYSDNHEYAVKRFYRDGEKLIFKPESNDTSFYDYITDISNDSLVIHGKVVLYIVELG